MSKPKKTDGKGENVGRAEPAQVGWRLEARDRHLLEAIDQYALKMRYSRNTVVTIAVERFVEWLKAEGHIS